MTLGVFQSVTPSIIWELVRHENMPILKTTPDLLKGPQQSVFH